MLDSKDLEILLNLQKNPLATISQIAENIKLSVSNTSARINKLEKENIIIQGIFADLNLDALEMEIFDVFFKVDSKEDLITLENDLGHYHPYMLYRSRCSGTVNGLYTQFRVPNNCLENLEILFTKLEKKNIITKYNIIQRRKDVKAIRFKSSLEFWDSKKQIWEFDWSKWITDFHNYTSKQKKNVEQVKPILSDLDELDIKLLAELTMDSRRKNTELMKSIEISDISGNAQKISRKLKYLKEKAIDGYRIFLHWSKMDLYQSICVVGYCDDNIACKIQSYLSDSTDSNKPRFPFQSMFFVAEGGGFLWYVRAPPSHLSNFLNFIWEISPQHDLYYLDYQYSQIYGLWDQTFDAEKKAWKASKEFMVDGVLEQMFKK